MNIEEWPEGATHKINGVFTKWEEGLEYRFRDGSWYEPNIAFSLNSYVRLGSYEIITRPGDEPYTPKVGEDSLLPSIGETVGIKLASMGEEIIPHVVTGYKVWNALESSDAYHRVFILLGQSEDSRSGNNERLLKDVYRIKAEREEFMNAVAEAVCSASIEQMDVKSNVKRIAGILFDAGFTNKP